MGAVDNQYRSGLTRYLVLDPEEYESFTSFDEALECAKSDVGSDGWVPCDKLVVCRIEAEVKETKVAPTVKLFQKGA